VRASCTQWFRDDLTAAVVGSQLYGWKGTRWGGRPGTEFGNSGGFDHAESAKGRRHHGFGEKREAGSLDWDPGKSERGWGCSVEVIER